MFWAKLIKVIKYPVNLEFASGNEMLLRVIRSEDNENIYEKVIENSAEVTSIWFSAVIKPEGKYLICF